jgi:hypothetical protein
MYAFFRGDFLQQDTGVRMYSLFDWITTSDPSSTAFCGVDRTVNPTALSGLKPPSSTFANKSILDKLRAFGDFAAAYGTSNIPLTHFLVNPVKWGEAASEMLARGENNAMEKNAEYGYEKIIVRTAVGSVALLPEPNMPSDKCLALAMPKDGSNIQLIGMGGEVPHIMTADGLTWMRSSSNDSYELRTVGYPALVVRAPGSCGAFSI